MDIGVDRELGRRKHALLRHHVGALQAEALAEVQPFLDAALTFPWALAGAVVVDHPLGPDPAQLGIDHARHEGGILNRDAALVVVAVERPGLDLPFVESAVAHQVVEGRVVVVALGADLHEARFELIGGLEDHGRTISMPS